MFAASTYEEIERIESQVENMEIVVFLFARPTEEKILKEFEYIHYNSARYCSIYAIGYTDDFTKAEVVNAIKSFIPNFEHEEKGKNLDQKM